LETILQNIKTEIKSMREKQEQSLSEMQETTKLILAKINISEQYDKEYSMLMLRPGMNGPYGRTQLTYPVTHFIRACVWIGSNECEGPATGQRQKVSLTRRF